MVLLAAPGESEPAEPEPSIQDRLRAILISGAAITIPVLVTVVVLSFIVNFILGAISPLVVVIERALGVGPNLSELELELLAVGTLVALVFVVGLVAETRPGNELERLFDTAVARIPGVGSVYTSFNEMSELLLSNDTQSFREVKLVEYPSEGMYTVAFVTADTPEPFREGTGHDEMTTLFMPLAPNPVMGGFVLHVAEERVHDVDISVEEGIRSIVTSGVATGDSDQVPADGELVDLTAIRKQARNGIEDLGDWSAQTAEDISDLHTMTVEEIEAFGEHTRQELLNADAGRADAESDDAPRHYMLAGDPTDEDDESADETSGSDSSATGADSEDEL